MAFDDKKFGEIFPTRTGEATGTANERKMLDVIGGSQGFRTQLRTDANGVTTMLRTKNGMPQFSNSPTVQETPEVRESVYMETGELTWTFPGPEAPARLDSAKWRFNNIPTNDPWLGKASTAGTQATKQPTPADTGVLRDNIESLAIGYPRKLYPDGSVNPSSDADSKTAYGDATVLKKLVAGFFPPEIFSGKLRAFMQAQYGAVEKSTGFNFSLDVLGESALLYYQPAEIEGAPRIQFGFWSHSTTGLFTAPGYNYYLIQITSTTTPGVMAVNGLPIRLTSAGKTIRKALIAGTIAGPDIKKAEGYMFADAVIETGKQFLIGTFAPGACGSGGGGAIAFGWKFNWAGTKPAIVLVGTVGDETSHTLDGRAREVLLTIDRSAVYDGFEAGKWLVSSASPGELSWLDGWGSFNIMAPWDEVSSQLQSYSHKITWGTVGDYDYSNVPVYGYYNKDDVWTTVRLSKEVWSPVPRWEQEQSGLVINPVVAGESVLSAYPSIPWKEAGARKSTDNAWVEMKEVQSWERMTISIGGWSFVGERKGGLSDYYEVTVSGGGYTEDGPQDSIANYFADGVYGPAFTFLPQPPGFDDFNAALIAAPFGYQPNGATYTVQRIPCRHRHTTSTYDEFNRWTLVIPCGDSDAVHVATSNYRYDSGVASWYFDTHSWGAQTNYVMFFDSYPNSAANWHQETFDFSWCWVGFMYETASTWTQDNEPRIYTDEIGINAWSRSLLAAPGTPSGSYSTLFTVDRGWPYFNGTIRFKESAHGHYHGTEGYNSGGVFKNSLFVGWY